MFFTAYDYSYKGFESAPKKEMDTFIDTSKFIFGTLNSLYAHNSSLSMVGKVFEINELKNEWIALGSDYSTITGAIKHEEKIITTIDVPDNRSDQLEEYKDSEGRPYLLKTAAVFVKSVEGVELKFGINDCAQSVFKVNYEKELNGKINYTRFTNQIALKVAKYRSGDIVSCFDGIVTKFIGEPNKKELEFDKIETISLLPYGKNQFVFKPKYSGNYEFDIVLPEDSIIYFNDEKYYYSNSKITKFLHFGEQVNIEIVNTKITQLGSIIVKLSNNISNEKLYQDEKLLICLGDIEGVKRISTGDSNVVIDEILYSFNNKLESYICNNEGIEECSILSYPFKNNLKYFVVLKNNSKQELSINEPKIEDVDEICIDNGNEIPIFNNYTYYKFETKKAAKYVFSFDKNCDYIIIDNNLNEKINYLHKLNNAFAINLGNNIYYIGIKSDSYSKINFKVILFENAYKWKIKENNKEYYPKEDEINLEIDKVYNFTLMTNDVDVDIYYNSTTINSQITKNISEKGELKIPSDVRIDESITVTAMDRSTDKAICTISVKPQLNLDKVNVSSFNDEGLGFNVVFPKYVHFVRYELGFGSKKLDLIAFNSDPEKVESLNKDILDDYKNLNLISYNGEIIINIYEIGALDRNKNDKTYKCNFSLKLNNLFYSGTGTSNDPYIISSKRHFKNIKYTASNSYYYKLNNDIDISEYHDSFGMTEFRGVLDGNEHEIIGFEHIINLGQFNGPSFETNFGLFRVNYGTIKNLTLVNFGIKTNSNSIGNANRIVNIGIFCGINYGRIENCKCKPNGIGINFNCVEANAGGIAGTNGGTIIDCFVNYLTIDSIGNSGLIVGHNNAYGVISKCTGDGRIICHYKEANQEKQYSVGGIAGTNQGKINYCKNYGIVSFYLDTPCDSRILQPRMGMIIGTNYKDGSYEGCQSFNEVDKTGLKTVSWTEGWLWNKKTYEHNQAYYCGSMCGQDYR